MGHSQVGAAGTSTLQRAFRHSGLAWSFDGGRVINEDR